MAVHNAILTARPDLLPSLYRGYHYRHSEASSLGGSPTTANRIPVYGMDGGRDGGRDGERLVCHFNGAPIGRSLAEDAIENDAAALEALDLFNQTALSDALMYQMMLEPGDLQFLNNRAVMHGRTRFDDVDDLSRKRLMLRLWLRMTDWPELPGHMKLH
jgi:hypothetical protein